MDRSASRRLVLVLLPVFLGTGVGLPRVVDAHALAPSVLELHERGQGHVDVFWKTPLVGVPDTGARPVLPSDCRAAGAPEIHRSDAALGTRWEIACASPTLVGSEIGATAIAESRAAVLVLITLRDGRSLRAVLTPEQPVFFIPARQRAPDVARGYVLLGIEHILTGVDHLLFVLGLLLLVGTRRRLVWTLTAFTLGHSVTLSLAALGLVHVPTAPIEAAIAGSILAVAVELGRDPATRRAASSWTQRRPWTMAAAFGLLHGLGFAGALVEAGLPDGEIPLALFSFNVGIEIGQLAFVTGAVALASSLVTVLVPMRSAVRRLVPAYAIGSLAAFWVIERLALLV